MADVANLHAGVHSVAQLLGTVGRDAATAAREAQLARETAAQAVVESQLAREAAEHASNATIQLTHEVRAVYRRQHASMPDDDVGETTGVMLRNAVGDAAKVEVLQDAIKRRDSDMRALRSQLDKSADRRLELWKVILGAVVTLVTGAGGAVGLLHVLGGR